MYEPWWDGFTVTAALNVKSATRDCSTNTINHNTKALLFGPHTQLVLKLKSHKSLYNTHPSDHNADNSKTRVPLLLRWPYNVAQLN